MAERHVLNAFGIMLTPKQRMGTSGFVLNRETLEFSDGHILNSLLIASRSLLQSLDLSTPSLLGRISIRPHHIIAKHPNNHHVRQKPALEEEASIADVSPRLLL
jgi:hypothetical protein